MSISKQDVLNNIDEVKKYILESEQEKEEKVIGIAIKNRLTGSIIFQSTKTTFREAVQERLESSANLRGTDLCNADLRGANLCNADLRGADLCNADLSGADLCNANLSGADLCGANLCNANLCGAELQNAKFYGKGGSVRLTKSQLPNFLTALGFILED